MLYFASISDQLANLKCPSQFNSTMENSPTADGIVVGQEQCPEMVCSGLVNFLHLCLNLAVRYGTK